MTDRMRNDGRNKRDIPILRNVTSGGAFAWATLVSARTPSDEPERKYKSARAMNNFVRER